MGRLRFAKMHGIGNDYVFVDCFEQAISDPAALARRISPRRTGVGSDGLILICPSAVADCRMVMYNADGSRGRMCGNGIRCVGKYMYERRRLSQDRLSVETDSGIRHLTLHVVKGQVGTVTVDMGEPVLSGSAIPVAAEGLVIDTTLDVAGRPYRATCVSIGNPHCVVFVDDLDSLPLDRIGPVFERHPFFPEGVNTEFVSVVGRGELSMRVWERGSGETAACGTGACAAVVAAVLNNHTDRTVTVHLLGGDLSISWVTIDNHVTMTGAAVEVFAGEIDV
jgi:diaminopimelate epimerase